MLQLIPLPLVITTLAHVLGSSLAAPGPPIEPSPFSPESKIQLNGVPGPYHDGTEGADSARIAGVLATLILHEADNETESKATTETSDLSLFVVLNEYKDNHLIRQSSCFQEIENGVPVFEPICRAIIGYPMKGGPIGITSLQKMLKDHLFIETKPGFKQRVERRKTMSLLMENAESGFSFSVQSNGTISEKIILGEGGDLHETEIAEGVFDFIWRPKDESERYIEPYSWTKGETLA